MWLVRLQCACQSDGFCSSLSDANERSHWLMSPTRDLAGCVWMHVINLQMLSCDDLVSPVPLQIRSASGRTPTTSRKGRCSSSSTRCTPWLTLCTTCTRSSVRARWASALRWTPSTARTCSSTSAASTSQVSRVSQFAGSTQTRAIRTCVVMRPP